MIKEDWADLAEERNENIQMNNIQKELVKEKEKEWM